jgi:hypothetical protein
MPQPTRAVLAFATTLLCATTGCRFPTGRIEGTVRDHSGQPIANVSVGVMGLAHLDYSDTSGKYRLTSVPVGTHRLRATVAGYEVVERDSVVVREGAMVRVDFTLDRTWTDGQLDVTPNSRALPPPSPLPSSLAEYLAQNVGFVAQFIVFCPRLRTLRVRTLETFVSLTRLSGRRSMTL